MISNKFQPSPTRENYINRETETGIDRNFGRSFAIFRFLENIPVFFVTIEKTGNGPKGAREGTEIMVQNYYNTSWCIEAGTRAAYSVIIIDRWGAILKWPEGILYIYVGSSENREITDNHREREVTRLDSPLTITATL